MSLFSSILPCLLAAFGLGALLGWALKSLFGDRRVSDLEESWAARLRGKESEWEMGNAQLRSQVNTLQTNLNSASDTVRAHEASLTEWNTKYGLLEAALTTRTAELEKLNADADAKYSLLEADLSAKSAGIEKANNEWQGKYAALEAALAAKTAAFDNLNDDWKAKFQTTETRLAEKNFALDRANADWTAKYKLLEDSVAAKSADLETANSNWLGKYGLLEAALAAKVLDFDRADTDWKAKFSALENDLKARNSKLELSRQELAKLQARIAELEPLTSKAKDWELKFLQISGDKETEIKELQQQLSELEPLRAQAKDWELKYTAILQERETETANLRGRISELEPLSLQVNDWQSKFQTTVAEKDETINSLRNQLSAAGAAATITSVASVASTSSSAPKGDLLLIEGIGEHYRDKLNAIDVFSQARLLERGATAKGRKELAELSGIPEKLILRWVNHIDLIRIKGIGPEFAELLEAAGVDSVPELAQRNAENLQAKLGEVNDARNLVGRVPSVGEVADWIQQAKELPRVVTH